MPLNECRIRICLNHNHSDYELTQIVHSVIRAAKFAGVATNDITEFPQYTTFDYIEPEEPILTSKNRALAQILSIITNIEKELVPSKKVDKSLTEDALSMMRRYGFGAGSSRTINGTFVQHVELEQYIGSIHHDLSCLTFYDRRIATFSMVQALARPLNGMKIHTLLIPAQVNESCEEGINCIRKTKLVKLQRYESNADMLKQVSACKKDQSAITVVVPASHFSCISDVETLFEQVKSNAQKMKAITIMIDACDMGNAAKFLGMPCQVNLKELASRFDIRFLMLGTFYSSYKLPGAYVISDPHLISELRFAAPGKLSLIYNRT